MDAAPSDDYIRLIQRKNGRIIIRAMLDLEKVTFESIVGKICEDFNVSFYHFSVFHLKVYWRYIFRYLLVNERWKRLLETF